MVYMALRLTHKNFLCAGVRNCRAREHRLLTGGWLSLKYAPAVTRVLLAFGPCGGYPVHVYPHRAPTKKNSMCRGPPNMPKSSTKAEIYIGLHTVLVSPGEEQDKSGWR